MPEITAEQLAARKHHSITVLGEQCYIWAVTQAEHDLILAALREHEVRAAVCHDAMCDRHWIAGAQFGWNAGSAGDSGSFQMAIKARRRDLVEAAVEKAVRP